MTLRAKTQDILRNEIDMEKCCEDCGLANPIDVLEWPPIIAVRELARKAKAAHESMHDGCIVAP